jgi:hypothetical protein
VVVRRLGQISGQPLRFGDELIQDATSSGRRLGRGPEREERNVVNIKAVSALG